ncbi:hypothetical protein Forpi1262_v018642 [Fusarium oxysporum f. sp. raphani]|uniref:Helitron helicase-like domain-containing protein n=1 Tax=Fusarium oxysporum f. sp. raphani TaxID=96318 RepID=A0A8J5NGX8_FUSOX|nr:hypothetical protein Forpi1262_v018642 [Fusarium oxysporum f. sp. raphani]
MQVRGQQYKYRGHIVHFLRDVGKVYRQLPLLPSELDVILLRPPNASEHADLDRQFRRQFRVRRPVSRRGWISCAVAIRATEILLSARSGSDLVPDLLPEDTEMEALIRAFLAKSAMNRFLTSLHGLSTLFPRGQADFVEPRLRPIKYADYIQHALRWHDGRFARHPTFRFVVFNTLMRAQARAKSSYFVKQHHQRRGPITRDDLLEAFQNPESADAQQLLNSINRQTAQLRGTRPYWYRKRRELESYATTSTEPLPASAPVPRWQELPEQQRMGMSSKLLGDNPHIAAWHFYRRFGLFRDIVLKQKFNVTDYWNSLGRQILPYVSHHNPLLSFASRLMNKLLAERDFSGQEICHVLLNCELQEGTRVVRAVDCRPYEQQGRSLRLQGDHDDAEVVGIYDNQLEYK